MRISTAMHRSNAPPLAPCTVCIATPALRVRRFVRSPYAPWALRQARDESATAAIGAIWRPLLRYAPISRHAPIERAATRPMPPAVWRVSLYRLSTHQCRVSRVASCGRHRVYAMSYMCVRVRTRSRGMRLSTALCRSNAPPLAPCAARVATPALRDRRFVRSLCALSGPPSGAG